MIDTDKYEGHTGPWLLIDGDIYKGGPKGTHKSDNMIADTAFGGYETTKARHADTMLMVDAPLLFEEVMRLREALINVQRSLVWDEKDRAMDGDPITLEALVAQVEEVRSDITEMIV